MRIEAPRRISRPIPLTPLIDVVFLLLMFFMLSTTFAKFGLFGLGGSVAGNTPPDALQQASLPEILIDVGAGPAIRVNGRSVALGDLVPRLNNLHDIGLKIAVIRVRSDATVQDMLSVLEVARGSSLRSIALVH